MELSLSTSNPVAGGDPHLPLELS